MKIIDFYFKIDCTAMTDERAQAFQENETFMNFIQRGEASL